MPTSLKRKSILLINGSSDLYGASRILSITATCLHERYDLTLYLPRPGPLVDLFNQVSPQTVVKIVPSLPVIQRSMRSVRGMWDMFSGSVYFSFHILFNFRYYKTFDLIFINTLSCAPLIKIFKLFNFGVCVHVHEILSNEDFLTRQVNLLAIRSSDYIIAVSGAVNSNLSSLARSSTEKHKITTINNGIDDYSIAGSIKKHSKTIFTLFGRIKPEKGQWYFLEALLLIDPALYEHAEFRIIGSPVQSNKVYVEWLEKIDQFRDTTDIQLQIIGFISDIRSYLDETDIVLVPSLMQEPFSTLILEGLSAGKIVVATNVGGSAESIQDGITGILIEPDSPQQFANLISELITKPQQYHFLKENARKSYLDNFTVGHYRDKLNSFISGII